MQVNLVIELGAKGNWYLGRNITCDYDTTLF